jgi:colicin import membrane protein
MSAATADNFFADHAKYLVAALVLHVVVVVLLTVTINSSRQAVVPAQLAIKATIVDNSAKRIKREKEQAETERVERERVAAEKKQAEEVEAKKEEERQEEERQAKQAEVKRQQQLVADKKQKADAERLALAKKKTDDDKKRAADSKTKQAEKQKAERDAREQAQREAELKRQLADEEGVMQAQNSGLMSQYAALIEQKVVRNWTKPATARAGIQCEVKVTQAPGGMVMTVEIDKCNGDAAVQESIKNAVNRSSPLPAPPDARLFQRVIVFVFKPRD